ncbi:MAG: T9SS type A sorting domain-containing protein [Bacteroidetes bacterium]|nr:T9SS type A sorting domain-containing protein [Bacteroidota bacterium]
MHSSRFLLILFLLCPFSVVYAQVPQSAPQAIVVTAVVNDMSCSSVCDGVITASVSPAGVYQYAIDNLPFQSSNVFSNLCAGTYRISVRNSFGDNDTAMVTVGVMPPPVAQYNTQAATCASLCGGVLEVSQVNPPGFYQFSINNGPYQTDSVFAGLCPGMQAIALQRVPGCVFTDSAFIDPAPVFTIQVTTDSTSCLERCDGSIQIQPSLPGSYQYQLNNTTPQASPVFASLCAGSYQVVVTGQPGCTDSATVVVAAPPFVTLSASVILPACHNYCDAELSVQPSLPGNYEYSIDSGLTYQPFNVFTALCSGVYPVQAKNENGCLFYFTQTIPNPPLPPLTVVPANPLCANSCNGAVELLSPGAVQFVLDTAVQAQNTFFNLCAGSYVVSIADSAGCFVTDSVTLTDPPPLQLQAVVQASVCNNCNGNISPSASGGTPGYTFSFFDGSGPVSGNNLCAGTYSVLVSDSNSCTGTDTVYVISIPAIHIDSAVVVSDVDSAGTGSAAVYVSGSNAVSFVWSPAVSGSSSAAGLLPGVYCVSVTDSAGCADSVCVTVGNIISGMDEPAAQAGISVFPNPFSNELNVQGVAPQSRFRLSDASGRLVLEGVIPFDNRIGIPADLAPGSYYITVYSGLSQHHQPVMKTR